MTLLQGEELESRARALGVDVQGDLRIQGSSGRVSEVERSLREARLWLLAVISAIPSELSAAAAIIAVSR